MAREDGGMPDSRIHPNAIRPVKVGINQGNQNIPRSITSYDKDGKYIPLFRGNATKSQD